MSPNTLVTANRAGPTTTFVLFGVILAFGPCYVHLFASREQWDGASAEVTVRVLAKWTFRPVSPLIPGALMPPVLQYFRLLQFRLLVRTTTMPGPRRPSVPVPPVFTVVA